MTLYVDRKFANLIANKLDHFAWKEPNLANCRCPFCGDSAKNKFKARGYLYVRKDNLFYKCHNCSVGMPFGSFLKHVDPNMYNEYVLEAYKNNTLGNHANKKNKKTVESMVEKSTKAMFDPVTLVLADSIADLPKNHYVRKYLDSRKIPKEQYKKLMYVDDFKAFVDRVLPNHGKELKENDRRIIIPFYDFDGKLFMFQGRAMAPDTKSKYMSIKLDKDAPKVYGLDTVDLSQKVYVVEGPIDSMFLHNGIATGDSNLASAYNVINHMNFVCVFDNEPRNVQICDTIKRTIDDGFSVCIWPENTSRFGKDINEQVMNGLMPSEIQHIIDKNTFTGIEAIFRFNQWKKV